MVFDGFNQLLVLFYAVFHAAGTNHSPLILCQEIKKKEEFYTTILVVIVVLILNATSIQTSSN